MTRKFDEKSQAGKAPLPSVEKVQQELAKVEMCEVSTGAHGITRVSSMLLLEPCMRFSPHTALHRH